MLLQEPLFKLRFKGALVSWPSSSFSWDYCCANKRTRDHFLEPSPDMYFFDIKQGHGDGRKKTLGIIADKRTLPGSNTKHCGRHLSAVNKNRLVLTLKAMTQGLKSCVHGETAPTAS